MTDGEKSKRFGLDKIAFFIMLIAGLLIAKLIVSSRGNFKPSAPISIAPCGISVSIPKGGGFLPLTDGFAYNDNEFRLSSLMAISSDSLVSVNWRYFIIPFKKPASERFAQQAEEIKGSIEKTGSEKFGQLTFDYARISSKTSSTLLISASALLPDGRTLSLEVAQKGQSINLADKVFDSIIRSASYTPNNSLAKGKKLIDAFKSKNLADLIKEKQRQNFYFIEDYDSRPIGFVTGAVNFKSDKKNPNSLVAANLYLIKVGVNSLTERSLLKSNDVNLNTFKWVSRQNDLLIRRQIITGIELDKEGKLTVRNEKIEQSLTASATMVPEILSDNLLVSFLQSDFNSVMVDMLFSDGRLIPAAISKSDMSAPDAKKIQNSDPNIVWGVDIQYYGVDASRQIVYFDKVGQILYGQVQGKISYKLEKTNYDTVISVFPDWVKEIEQIGQFIFEADKNKE